MRTITHVRINEIEASPWDRSKSYDDTIITKLRKNIRDNGGISEDHPIIVNKKCDGKLVVIDGSAKLVAAKMENIQTVPVAIEQLDNIDAAIKFLDINIQHKMNNLTIGIIGVLMMREDTTLGIATVANMLAEATGKDKSNITKAIKAAEVYGFIEEYLNESAKVILYKKSAKLYKISSLPREVWLTLGRYIATSTKCENLKKAINLVNSVTGIENNKIWREVFFPLNKMVSMSLKNKTGIVAIKESFKKLNDALAYLQANKDETAIDSLKNWLQCNAFRDRNGSPAAFLFRKVINKAYRTMNKANDKSENLIFGDCLEKIELLRDDSCDACVTDAPYGIAMHPMGTNKIPIINDTRENATNLIYLLAPKLYQKMKNNTFTAVFCSDKMFEVFKDAFQSANYKYVCMCVCEKNSHSQCDMVSSPLIATEYILLFRKGRPTWLESRNNIFRFTVPTTRTHAAEKPIDLLISLIKCISAENSLVIDPFCGSASTAKACQLTGRNFWTCEISKHHYELAYNRLFANS